MCNDRDKHGGTRRSFLRAAGLAGAGAAALGAGALGAGGLLDPQPALAAINNESFGRSAWQPDADSPRFTVAVMPDTQFLYFAPSIMPEPQLASFRYIVDRANGDSDNIVFMAHLGDLTEDGLADGVRPGRRGLRLPRPARGGLQRAGRQPRRQLQHRRPARRHAVPGHAMGPQRFARSKTFVGADSSRLQHRARLPRRRPRVAGAGAGLAAVARGLRLGQRQSSSSTRRCRSSSPRTRSPARPTTTACTPTSPATRRTTHRCPPTASSSGTG